MKSESIWKRKQKMGILGPKGGNRTFLSCCHIIKSGLFIFKIVSPLGDRTTFMLKNKYCICLGHLPMVRGKMGNKCLNKEIKQSLWWMIQNQWVGQGIFSPLKTVRREWGSHVFTLQIWSQLWKQTPSVMLLPVANVSKPLTHIHTKWYHTSFVTITDASEEGEVRGQPKHSGKNKTFLNTNMQLLEWGTVFKFKFSFLGCSPFAVDAVKCAKSCNNGENFVFVGAVA